MKNILIAIVSTFCMTAYAQSTNPDVKEITLDRATSISKLVKGNEKKSIRTLLLKNSDLISDNDIKFLSKMPSLETVQVSSTFTNAFSSNLQIPLNVKKIITQQGLYSKYALRETSSCSGDYWKLVDYANHIRNTEFLTDGETTRGKNSFKHSTFPYLEEVIYLCPELAFSTSAPDSLYVDYDCGNGFTAIIVPANGEIIFRKGVLLSAQPKEKLLSSYWMSSDDAFPNREKSIERLLAMQKMYSNELEQLSSANNKLQQKQSKKQQSATSSGIDTGNRLVIPASVCYISPSMFYLNEELQEIVFEEGDCKVYVGEGAFARCKNIKTLICKRPIEISNRNEVFEDVEFERVVFEKDCKIELSSPASNHHHIEKVETIEFYGNTTLKGAVAYAKTAIFKGNANLKELSISNGESVLFEGEATVEKSSLYRVEQMEFSTVPKAETEFTYGSTVIVPKGSKSKLPAQGANTKIVEKGAVQKTHWNIQMEKPGTMLSVLSPNDLVFVDSLTITGYLYDTDLKVLEDCKNMRYLDIRKTFITDSPETKREREANAAFFGAMFKAMGVVADGKYADGKMSSTDYLLAKGFTELMKPASDVKEAGEGCEIPQKWLWYHKKLETLLLPYRCSYIGFDAFKYCSNLKKVELPLYLKTMQTGAFAFCENLKEIEFPASLHNMGIHTMGGFDVDASCSFAHSGIEKMDLSKCKFRDGEWQLDLRGCNALKELRLPSNIETVEYLEVGNGCDVYFPATVKSCGYFRVNGGNIHCKGATAPSCYDKGRIKDATFYIPKGSTTSYYNAFGSNNTYIEE